MVIQWYTCMGGASYKCRNYAETRRSSFLMTHLFIKRDGNGSFFLAFFWKGPKLKEHFIWLQASLDCWCSRILSASSSGPAWVKLRDCFSTKVLRWRPTRSSSNRMRTETGWDSAGTCGRPADWKPQGWWSRSHASSRPSKRGLTCRHYNTNQ